LKSFYGTLASILGVLVSVLIAVQSGFSISEKSEFYRLIAGEGDLIKDDLNDLKLQNIEEEKFQSIRKQFRTLRKHADFALPRGKGMDAVQSMYKELNQVSKGNT
jgi:hypothetical protein